MRTVIAGGHGKIALLLARILRDAGHEPVGLIRDAAQSDDLESAGAVPLVLDLEHTTESAVVAALRGADAAVFAAGAGPASGAARKLTLDRDGAILFGRAAVAAGVPRLVVVSAIGTDDFDPSSDDVFQVYLRAKSEADAAVRDLPLDWVIVRPGGLTDDEGTGRVLAGEIVERGSIPRADVALTIARLLEDGVASRTQFELVSGDLPIVDALRAL